MLVSKCGKIELAATRNALPLLESMPGGGRRRVPATAVQENVSKTTTADGAQNALLRLRLMLRDGAEPAAVSQRTFRASVAEVKCRRMPKARLHKSRFITPALVRGVIVKAPVRRPRTNQGRRESQPARQQPSLAYESLSKLCSHYCSLIVLSPSRC